MEILLTNTMNFAPFLIIVAATLWALDGLLRQSLYGMSAPTLIFFEHLLGFLLIALFATHKFRGMILSRREVTALFAVSFLSGVIGTLFFTKALLAVGFIPFSVAILIQKLQPIFAIGLALMIGHERIPVRSYFFIAVALLAGYFVTFPHGVAMAPAGQREAVLYALIAAAAWGTSTNFSKYLLKNHHPEVITMLRFGLTMLMIGVGLVLIPGWTEGFRVPMMKEWLYLLTIAFSTGLLAMYIYYRGLRSVPVHVSAILELTWPIVAIIVDYVANGTLLAPSQYLATVVLIGAMYMVTHLAHIKGVKNLAQTEKSL